LRYINKVKLTVSLPFTFAFCLFTFAFPGDGRSERATKGIRKVAHLATVESGELGFVLDGEFDQSVGSVQIEFGTYIDAMILDCAHA
jgi:hypothetical protein